MFAQLSLMGWAVLATVATASGALVQSPPGTPPVAITHVNVIDVASGAIQDGRTVIIRDGRIRSVGPVQPVPAGAIQVDGRGRYLIPGLWDMHVHLSWATETALPVLVANGVTSVRDLGSDLTDIYRWRAEISAGIRCGPDIVAACGPILNGRSFNRYQLVTGDSAQARGVVRALKQAGVDFIKVHRRVERPVYFAIADEARRQGLPLVGHIPMTVTPAEASDTGQLIEHVETLFDGTFSTGLSLEALPDSIRRFRASGAESLFARFVRNRTPVTPVLAAWRWMIEHPDTTFLSDPHIRYVPRSARESARAQPPFPSSQREATLQLFEQYREVVGQMNRAHVTLLAGTDLAAIRIPGFGLHAELAELVGVGLTPLEALRAATLNAARLLGRERDEARITPGAVANLVLLDANPLKDIHNTQRIHAVILRGRLFRRTELDELLRRTAAEADRR